MPYNTVITFTAFDVLPAASLNNNFSNLDFLKGKLDAVSSQFILLSSAMWPMVTLGAASATKVEMATNTNNYIFMDFADTGTTLRAEITFPMPSDYGGGTVTAKFYWTANSTSTNSVVWRLSGVAIADGEALDVTNTGVQIIADANGSSANTLRVSGSTPAITIGGTPAAGELVTWRISRESGNASDTLAATARLIAVAITYTRA